METARFSETLAFTDKYTRQFKPKEHYQNCHRLENLKSHAFPIKLQVVQKNCVASLQVVDLQLLIYCIKTF
jgi:hypothetical protein